MISDYAYDKALQEMIEAMEYLEMETNMEAQNENK